MLVAAAAALAGTAVVATVPDVHPAYHAPRLQVALETVAAAVALLAALLAYGRFRHDGRRLDDLALVVGLVLLSGTNVLFSALPAALRPSQPVLAAAMFAEMLGFLVASGVLAASTYLPRSPVARRRAPAVAIAGAGAVLVAIGSAALLAAPPLPAPADVTVLPGWASSPATHGTLVTALHAEGAIVLALAAVGFGRRARMSGDELRWWLCAAAALAAVARVNYLVFPSAYSDWVSTGDVLRLVAILVLFAGATRDIGRLFDRAAVAAVDEERRRIARDLHDGIAQELAYIRRSSPALLQQGDAATARRIAEAAERALAESRTLIVGLAGGSDAPLPAALRATLVPLAARLGVRLDLDLDGRADVDRPRRDELVRIAREAVTNAARHSGSQQVRVHLRRGAGGVRLVVRDEGVGFDGETADGRHGITSMRERAAAIGAAFEISSRRRAGTAVEVTLG